MNHNKPGWMESSPNKCNTANKKTLQIIETNQTKTNAGANKRDSTANKNKQCKFS